MQTLGKFSALHNFFFSQSRLPVDKFSLCLENWVPGMPNTLAVCLLSVSQPGYPLYCSIGGGLSGPKIGFGGSRSRSGSSSSSSSSSSNSSKGSGKGGFGKEIIS